ERNGWKTFFRLDPTAESGGRREVYDLEFGHTLTEPYFEPHALPERLVALGSGTPREPLGHTTRVGEQREDPLDRYGEGLNHGSADRVHERARRSLVGSHHTTAVSTG